MSDADQDETIVTPIVASIGASVANFKELGNDRESEISIDKKNFEMNLRMKFWVNLEKSLEKISK